MFTLKEKGIFRALICLIITLLFFSGAMAKNDVRPGMKIKDAMSIARDCIHESSGIDVEDIRPGDTLQFLGVTDELRLDSLRRYIVRNIQIGVQNVWAYPEGQDLNSNPNRLFAQHYIISNSAFDKMAKTWTVEQLAREISKNAGLPFLPIGKASQIVADCRYIATGKKDQPRSSVLVRDDIADRKKFTDCFLTNKEKGLSSAGITSPEGDEYAYIFAQPILDEQIVQNGIDNSGWTYNQLITFTANNAQVPISPKLSATLLVVNAALNLLPAQIQSTFKSRTVAGGSSTFRLSDILGRIKRRTGRQIDKDYTLAELGIDPGVLNKELSRILRIRTDSNKDYTGETSNQIIQADKGNDRPLSLREFDPGALKIESDWTLEEIINEVEKVIKKQSTPN